MPLGLKVGQYYTGIILDDDLIKEFLRRKDISDEMRNIFELYNRPDHAYLNFDDYRGAFEMIRDNSMHFIFADMLLATHFLNLHSFDDMNVYFYNNGFKSTEHIPVGKGNPFKLILNKGIEF